MVRAKAAKRIFEEDKRTQEGGDRAGCCVGDAHKHICARRRESRGESGATQEALGSRLP